jgi:gliding motility-associated-like protein
MVTVTDANLCSAIANVTITEPTAITGSAAVTTTITCNGGIATVTLTGAGGTAPLSYTFNGVTNATGIFAGVTAGVAYPWSITDANLCGPFTGTLTVTEPAVVTGSAAITTAIACNGVGTATVTLTGAGGTAPLSYTFNGVTNATGIFAGIPVGVAYPWSITDANLCGPVTGNLTVTEPAVLTGSAAITTAILCNSGTATVTLTGAGGTAPLSYTFNGMTNATGIFAGIPAGVAYPWSVTDANLCGPVTGTLTVTEPTAVTGSAAITTAILCNGGTATVTLTGAGGTVPLSYTFNGVTNATGIFAGIPAGVAYVWSVNDANLCGPAGLLDVTQPSTLTGSISSQTDVSISGGNNGSVTVSGSGGTVPYLYQLGSGAFQASGTFGTLTAGSYTVTVQDNNGCTVPVAVIITQPVASLSGTATQTNVSCFGSSNGTITVTGVGGVPPYDYSLNGGTFQTSDTFSSLAAGTYTVTVRDAALSTFDVSVTITQPASSVTGSINSQTNVLCFGSTTGSVTVSGSGGTAPYQYKLGSGAYQTSGSFATLGAGTFTVTVQDANLCTFDVLVTITQTSAALKVNTLATTNVSCSGSTNGTISANASGGTSPYTYSLNGGTAQISGTFGNLAAATYTVTVVDANLCTANTQITVTEPDVIAIASTVTNVSCPGEEDGSITLAVTGGSQPYNVIWADGVLTQDRKNITDGTYSVVVTDINGCAKSLVVVVGVTGSDKCIEIPDVITPNNDGFNDTWKIKNIDMFPNAEVFVFTRWGKLVFKSKNLAANPWNGTFKGKLLPADSYHYVLHLNDGSKPRSGAISIIR